MSSKRCELCVGQSWVMALIDDGQIRIDACWDCNPNGKIDRVKAMEKVNMMIDLWPQVIDTLTTAQTAFEVADMNMVEPEVGELRICAEQAGVLRDLLKKMRTLVP